MRCINCGTDNNLKDRTANQGRCKNCNHPFVFEPTAMGNVKITDPFFAKALTDISVNNTLSFTAKQLFYLLDTRLKSKSFSGCGILFLYPFLAIWSTLFIGGILSSIIGNASFIIVLIFYNIAWIIYLFSQSKSSKLNRKARKTASNLIKILGFFLLSVAIIFGLLIYQSFPFFAISVLMGMSALYLGFKQTEECEFNQEFIIDENELSKWLNRWQDINGTNTQILPSPQNLITPTAINPDVTAYSFDRLIVCDRAEIAQFLIANNFHFEHNCAILSIDRYPQNIFETTMTMLRRNPDLKVYALHDCSPQGVKLVFRLQNDPNWFLNTNIPIIDLGIIPRQIMSGKRGMFIQSSTNSATAAKSLPIEIKQTLSTEELAWLEAGNFVELESIRPLQLIKIIQRGIAGYTSSLETGDSDGILFVGSDSSDTYIYTADSFG